MTREKIFLFLLIALILGLGGYVFFHKAKIARFFHIGAGSNTPVAYAEGERLTNIPVFLPHGNPRGLVIFVSDKGTVNEKEAKIKDAFIARNLIVAEVRFDNWRDALDKEDGECIYLVSDLEALAKDIARRLGLDHYYHPVIAGIGEGAILSYVSASDSPESTLAGAVSIDGSQSSHTRLPSCVENTTVTKSNDGGFDYSLNVSIPVPAIIIGNDGSKASLPVELAEKGAAAVVFNDIDEQKRIKQGADAALTYAIADAVDENLPIIDMPSEKPAKAIVIFFSGDGGWRDIDMQIGDWLQKRDVHVVGVDSLRYFWSKKTPEEMAHDIENMIKKADPEGKLPVGLFGYSFGADAMPFTWPMLDNKTSTKVKLIALMGLSTSADFQVSIDGWLGGSGDLPVVPALEKMPVDKTICIYGEDEDDSACADVKSDTLQRIKLSGGHHFDEDYESLSQLLYDNLMNKIGK